MLGIEGVRRAEYEPQSQELIVQFDETAVTIAEILDALRAAGFDARK